MKLVKTKSGDYHAVSDATEAALKNAARTIQSLTDSVAQLERIERAACALAEATDNFEELLSDQATPEMWRELRNALYDQEDEEVLP